MIRCISSITAALAALLIASGVHAAPASGPVEKGFDLPISERNAKPKKKKKAAEEEAAEEAEAEEEEKPKKKKGKKAKKEEPPPEEEEAEEEEKPKKKGKGKKGKKKEEPPPEPEEEEVDVKDTESPTAAAEEEEELPEEAPAEEAPASEESEEEGEKAEASVSTDDAAGKLYLGARLGFGLFLGKATGDDPALVDFSNKIPIWLDLGYRITPSLLVGLYGQIAPSTMKCPDQFFCSGATVMRFGAQVQYGFSPEASFAPWAGLGIGYEIASGSLKTGGIEGSFTVKGVEFLNLQAGADFMVSKAVGVGPFLSFSLGRYSSGDFEIAGTTDTGGIAKKEFHEWLVLGVRGAFSL
jgi:outer membrane biosynthesis protein TonB